MPKIWWHFKQCKCASTVNPVLQNLSQQEQAKCVLEESKISFDMKLHTFTVMGLTCPHIVTLFPKETCSCPSTTQCYHILAAKMTLGQNDDRKKKLNLTQLCKNSWSRSNKKSGRKCPHPGDCDVTAAPDVAVKPKLEKGMYIVMPRKTCMYSYIAYKLVGYVNCCCFVGDSDSESLTYNSKLVNNTSDLIQSNEQLDQSKDSKLASFYNSVESFV